MFRTLLLTSAALAALSFPASSEEQIQPIDNDPQTAFSQAIKSIKGWFGSDKPEDIAPAAGETTTAGADDLQVPPPVNGDPANIEPAAGFDEDTLQAPPPYYGPQSNAAPRASAFDGNASVAAFGEQAPSAADIANIMPAAGDGAEMNRANMDCDAILKAANEAEEGDIPDTALIEACETPIENADAPAGTETTPAQPAFEINPMEEQAPLPATQPAAGEPPIGEAVMPGEEQPAE